jgi:hypothetical protein
VEIVWSDGDNDKVKRVHVGLSVRYEKIESLPIGPDAKILDLRICGYGKGLRRDVLVFDWCDFVIWP